MQIQMNSTSETTRPKSKVEKYSQLYSPSISIFYNHINSIQFTLCPEDPETWPASCLRKDLVRRRFNASIPRLHRYLQRRKSMAGASESGSGSASEK
jgi:hypothetical protein